MILIYAIINTVNNKVYIGQTSKTLKQRWSQHVGRALREERSTYFNLAILKYGKENFDIEEIEYCPSSELADEKEKFWIKFYNSRDGESGYNLAEGGRVSRGFKWTQKAKDKISESRKNDPLRKLANIKTGETLRKKYASGEIPRYNLGKPMAKEIKDKLKESLKNSEKFKLSHSGHSDRLKELYRSGKMTPPWLGKHRSKESIDKMKKRASCIEVICMETQTIYPSICEAARQLGINDANLSKTLLGKNKTCGGFHWEYVKKEEKI